MITLIIIFVLVGFLLLVIISRFRQGCSNPTDDIYPMGDDSVYRVHHLGLAEPHVQQGQGDLGSRDMSHDPHSFDRGGDSGGGGDAGGGGDSGAGGGG